MESDPDLKNTHKFYEWSRGEMLDDWYKKVNAAYRLGKDKWFVNHNPSLLMWAVTHLGENPLGLNQTMFLKCCQNMMSDEQKAKYLPLISAQRILGTYAQTELGHGSDVSGLETTATFDQDSDEFIIHSPTITATKWWPGDLGLHCTHAIVFAKTFINGE